MNAPRGEATVRMMALPRDANWLGDIFGGWLMSHADVAGAVIAYRRARGKVVTVAVNEFQFLEAVFVGDILTFFACLDRVGTTSLRVDVDVYAERPGSEPGDQIHVATGDFTYVHIGDDRRPRAVPAAAGNF